MGSEMCIRDRPIPNGHQWAKRSAAALQQAAIDSAAVIELDRTAEFFACKFLDRRRALCFVGARDVVQPGIVHGIHRLSG